MKNKNPILKIFTSTFGIFVIVLVIIITIIFPTIKYIKELKQDIQQIEYESDEQYQKIKLLKKSIAELNTIQEKSEKLKTSMINRDDAIKIIQELENLAIEKKLSQNLTINEGALDSFIFNFNIRGNFYDTLSYLDALQHLPYYVIIDAINWTKVDENTVSLVFKATIFTK